MGRITGKPGTPASPARTELALIADPLDKIAPPRPIPPASLFRRLYRLWRPIPRSPSPASPEEAHKLQLVPRDSLIERFEWALGFLGDELGETMGAYLEFGVYNGSSMLCLLEALKRAGNSDMTLYGFDSFQGLPHSAAHEDGGVWNPGQFACPREYAEARLAEAVDRPGRIHLIEGWFQDTLSPGHDYGIRSASLVMIDSDTYSSAQLALRFSAPLLTNPCVVMFDDWRLNDLDVKSMGEYRAFHEWLEQYPQLRFDRVRSYNRKSNTIILRS